MATQLNMPQMGYDMEEGTVIRWLVEEGADVAIGDAVAEIETDKAAVDFESPVAGVLLKVLVAEGTTVPVGETIAIVGDAGEDLTAVDSDSEDEAEPAGAPDDSVADAPAAEPAAQGGPEPQAAEPQQERTAMFEDNFRASPVARKLAEEQGIDLSLIKGTGPGGRITRDDVLSFAPEPDEPEPEMVEEAPAEEEAAPETEMEEEAPAEEAAEPEAEMAEEEAPAEEAAEPEAEMAEEEAPAEEAGEPEAEMAEEEARGRGGRRA